MSTANPFTKLKEQVEEADRSVAAAAAIPYPRSGRRATGACSACTISSAIPARRYQRHACLHCARGM